MGVEEAGRREMGEGGQYPPPHPCSPGVRPSPFPCALPFSESPPTSTLGGGGCPLLQGLLSPGLPVSLQGREREGADGPGGHGTPRCFLADSPVPPATALHPTGPSLLPPSGASRGASCPFSHAHSPAPPSQLRPQGVFRAPCSPLLLRNRAPWAGPGSRPLSMCLFCWGHTVKPPGGEQRLLDCAPFEGGPSSSGDWDMPVPSFPAASLPSGVWPRPTVAVPPRHPPSGIATKVRLPLTTHLWDVDAQEGRGRGSCPHWNARWAGVSQGWEFLCVSSSHTWRVRRAPRSSLGTPALPHPPRKPRPQLLRPYDGGDRPTLGRCRQPPSPLQAPHRPRQRMGLLAQSWPRPYLPPSSPEALPCFPPSFCWNSMLVTPGQ